jgi:hypothetical protein
VEGGGQARKRIEDSENSPHYLQTAGYGQAGHGLLFFYAFGDCRNFALCLLNWPSCNTAEDIWDALKRSLTGV